MPTHILAPPPMAVYTPMGPTSPQVPMPDPAGMFSRRKTMVAMGPVIMDASVGGIQIRGLSTILPICSILVPRPWAISPPILFSR